MSYLKDRAWYNSACVSKFISSYQPRVKDHNGYYSMLVDAGGSLEINEYLNNVSATFRYPILEYGLTTKVMIFPYATAYLRAVIPFHEAYIEDIIKTNTGTGWSSYSHKKLKNGGYSVKIKTSAPYSILRSSLDIYPVSIWRERGAQGDYVVVKFYSLRGVQA